MALENFGFPSSIRTRKPLGQAEQPNLTMPTQLTDSLEIGLVGQLPGGVWKGIRRKTLLPLGSMIQNRHLLNFASF